MGVDQGALSLPRTQILGKRVAWLAGPLLILAVQLAFFGAPAGVLINGAVLGLITSLVALGMFLVYRANRVINFAQGELGLIPAVLAVMLITETGLPWLLALVVGLVASFALGGASEFLVIRRFFRAPRLVLTVATLGLAQALGFLALWMPKWWDSKVVSQRIDVPIDAVWDVGPIRLSSDHLLVLVVAPLVLLGVGALLRYTDLGIAVRAAAERPDRANSLGIPVKAIQTLVWAIAGTLAFLALFLRAGVIGLPVAGSLGVGLLLRALAALVIGRLEHLPTVLCSSIALGILHMGVDWNQSSSLVGDALMAAVIIVALILRKVRPERGELELGAFRAIGEVRRLPDVLRRLPEVRIARWSALLALGAFLLTLPHHLGTEHVLRLSFLYLMTMVLVSLVVLTGWAGQISLGQIAFVAVGSVAGAHATQQWGADIILATLLAGCCGLVAALVVGFPALRVRGMYLAVTTLAFAVAVTAYLLNPRFFDWLPSGRIERHPILGRIGWESSFAMYHVSLVAMTLTFIAVAGIRRSRTGRVLIALRENEAALEAFGVSARRAKLMAFGISGFIAAASGSLSVHHQQALVMDGRGAEGSLSIFVSGVAGGLGSLLGAAVGALWYWGGIWWLPGTWRLLATGGGVLLVLLILPGGLAGGIYQLRDAALSRLAVHRGIEAPGFTEDRLDAVPEPEATT
ncbi:MAG: ABC transporter permease [Actinobacteria bacterium]|nr:ABC transporter permease [Actinomycetota bacterium]